MKIEYLSIDGYKNLHSFEVSFEKGVSLLAIAGKNGSGKSNMLEAIASIFSCVITEDKEPDFKFTILYSIHGDEVTISNRSGVVEVKKNKEIVRKAQYGSIVPLTIFVYYAGETERLKNLANDVVDKIFDKAIKSGETPSYRAISLISINDFGISLVVNRCYKLATLKILEEYLGIQDVSNQYKIYLKRPSWGKNGKPEVFWNAKGYVKEVIEMLKNNGSHSIVDKDRIIINIPDCESIKDELAGPEGLFKSLKILMQADILDRIEIDVIKDGVLFDCNELSEGEKQLGNILSIIKITKDYSALFLLDEFDSYLHPNWQRAFAELFYKEDIIGQVIFTTHSPLTLSQMKNSNVFLLRNGKIYESVIDPYNRDVSEIMEELMEIPLRTETVSDLINEFNKNIAIKNVDAAKMIKHELGGLLSNDDPFFITADLSIARIERI